MAKLNTSDSPKLFYQNALDGITNRICLTKGLQTLLEPLNDYIPTSHKNRLHPQPQIYSAYNMKVDTSQWQRNRYNFSRLYQSLKNAGIQHSDILAVYGNPYLGMLTKWGTLDYQRQQTILKEYPGTDRLAESVDEMKRKLSWEISQIEYTKRDLAMDLLTILAGVTFDVLCPPSSSLSTATVAVCGARVAVRVCPKLGTVAAGLGLDMSRLYRKANEHIKKKASENTKPKVEREWGKGTYWDKLTSGKTMQSLQKLAKISKNRQEVRFDGTYYYQFDPMHKTQKVHLHKYIRKGRKVKPIENIDPETGEVISKIVKQIEETWF